MAKWTDIRDLEERIADAVQEYIDNEEGYDNPKLRVYLCDDDMEYHATMEDSIEGTEDDGVYDVNKLIRIGEDGELETDIDAISDVANEWVFLDH